MYLGRSGHKENQTNTTEYSSKDRWQREEGWIAAKPFPRLLRQAHQRKGARGGGGPKRDNPNFPKDIFKKVKKRILEPRNALDSPMACRAKRNH